MGVDKLSKENGGISIVGRYTTQKNLQNDYAYEMSWSSPKVIGTGMNGAVRLARGKDGRQYAVKSFNKKHLTTKARAELQGEVEIYLSVDHPHIARLEQVYETNEEIHLVMEYMAGGELYDHLTRKRMYTEEVAAATAFQMLLAVAYLHGRNICHRDLKLENFLYEDAGSNHLKLIDFGFAKVFTGSTMKDSCGSIHYVAPEVLKKSYTSQADMWSLGVISHMLLTGSPLFRGEDYEIVSLVKKGKFRLSSRFGKLSAVAQDFVQSLIVVDPAKRLTAQTALEHPFLANRRSTVVRSADVEISDGLRNFAQASRFRRVCLSMMAWSLSVEDRRRLRGKFLELDVEKKGVISLSRFKAALQESSHIDGAEAERLFAALDTNHGNTICYTELLAALLDDTVQSDESVLRRTFARFDREEAGEITVDNLRSLLGDTFDNVDVAELISDVDTTGSGAIRYEDFFQYLQTGSSKQPYSMPTQSPTGQRPEKHCSLVDALTDAELDLTDQRLPTPLAQKPMPSPVKLDRMPFTSSLMRAAAEAAGSCVRLPHSK